MSAVTSSAAQELNVFLDFVDYSYSLIKQQSVARLSWK